MALNDFEEAFPIVSRLPSKMHDIDAWVDSCYDKLWLFRFNRSRIESLRETFADKIGRERDKIARNIQRRTNRRARVNPQDALTPELIIQSVLAEFEEGDLGGSERPASPTSASRRRKVGFRPRSWRTIKLQDSWNIIENYVTPTS